MTPFPCCLLPAAAALWCWGAPRAVTALEDEPQTAWFDREGGLADAIAAATPSLRFTGGEWEWKDDVPSTPAPAAPPPAAPSQPSWPGFPATPAPLPPWAPEQELVCFLGGCFAPEPCPVCGILHAPQRCTPAHACLSRHDTASSLPSD